MTKKVEIKEHVASFKFAKDANAYLQLADAFLECHPEIIYWTERNNTKKGLFYRYASGLYSIISTLEVEQMLIDFKPTDAHLVVPSALSQCKQMETMQNIMRRRFFYRDNFNPEGIINFKNGFFNVEDGKLVPHTMNIISTNQLPYNYDPSAKCENFMKALHDATSSDPAKIAIIQEFAGYCLTRDTRLEKILFLIGASRSGKSTILDGITAMLGEDNVSCATMEKIGQPRYAGLFIDKIANIATEIPKDTRGFEEALKNITSGEKITVDTKFIPAYDARPYCKLIFAGNDLPAISDTSDAVFKRMLLVYFNNVVADEVKDTDLKYRVRKEGSGIFNWAYEGMKRLVANKKFTFSQEMNNNLEDLRVQNNSVYYFIKEHYEITENPEDFVVYDDLYHEFKDFCGRVGSIGIYKKIVFGKEIKKIFPKEINKEVKWVAGTTKQVWTGLRKKIEGISSGSIKWEES